jgi:ABC-2 type transport system ATP-binding protein
VDAGRVVAEGTPDELKSRLGGDRLDVVVHAPERLAEAAGIAARAAGGPVESDPDARRVSAPVADRVKALTEVPAALAAAGIEAEDITVRRPTLDEVFLTLTATPVGTGGEHA